MEIKLPEHVKEIIEKLETAGYEAYAVGGCVRDSLLGKEPEDWDITTSARPEEVKKVFKRTVDTGIEHGTVTVLMKEKPESRYAEEDEPPKYRGYEVTTYRVDGDYKDGRHPEHVQFTPSLKEDLKRRDFTINAMAYNARAGLVDAFDGKGDLSCGIIRCVGDPNERFSEDALRILRAVRFSAQLGFRIEEKTRAAIAGHAENLKNVSSERIQAELSKLLCSAHPERVAEFYRLSIAEHICGGFPAELPEHLPELWGDGSLAKADPAEGSTAEAAGENAFYARGGAVRPEPAEAPERNIPIPLTKKYLRYAEFLAGLSQDMAEQILKNLKLDNETVKNAGILAKYVLWYIPADRYAVKKIMQNMTPELMGELLRMKQRFRRTAFYRERCYGENAAELLRLYEDIRRKEDPVYLSDLIIKGSDLIAVGIKPGPHMGEILNAMLEDVLKNPVHNSVLYLLSQYL